MARDARKTRKPFRLSIRNRSLSFTPLGTRFVVVCVLVGFAAINTGSNLLYLCTAMMLSMVVVSGILSEQVLKGIKTARRVPVEVYAGEPFKVRYVLENTKRRTQSFALSVAAYPGGQASATAFMLRLPPGGSGECSAVETAGSRGWWTVEGFEVSTSFPFGLFRKSRRLPGREELLVFPPVVKLPIEIPRTLTRGAGESPAGVAGQGAELRSLRDYTERDEARLIHWKSSARLSRLLVKELEAEHKKTVTVILDDLAPGGDAEFEEAVALAAAAVRSLLLEHGVPVAFLSRGFRVPAGAGRVQYLAIMEGLSLASPWVESGVGEGLDAELLRALSEGPSVMVLPARGSDWSVYAPMAGLVLEARL